MNSEFRAEGIISNHNTLDTCILTSDFACETKCRAACFDLHRRYSIDKSASSLITLYFMETPELRVSPALADNTPNHFQRSIRIHKNFTNFLAPDNQYSDPDL